MISAVLLCGINVVEAIKRNDKGPLEAKVDGAKNASDALVEVGKIVNHPDKQAIDYGWVVSTIKSKAMAKGVTEQQWADALGLKYFDPNAITDPNVKKAIDDVVTAAQAVAAALRVEQNKPNSGNFWEVKQRMSNGLADFTGLVYSPRPK